MATQILQMPTEEPPKPTKKVYIRRAKITKGGSSKSRKRVMVARKIDAGQTIECSDNTKVSIPRNNSVTKSKIEKLPQSLAVYNDELDGPPIDENGKLVDWGLLGDPEDYMDLEMARSGKTYAPVMNVQQKNDREFVMTARSFARHEESRLEEEKLAKMLPEERLVTTKNTRMLQRWEAVNEDWANFKQKMMKRLDTHEGQLLISKTDGFRTKAETYDLVEKATPIWNKYGAIHWQMTLRGETSHFVPVGNSYAGLYCKIGNPVLTPESIRRPTQTYPRADGGWRDSQPLKDRLERLGKRVTSLQPNFYGQLEALKRPTKELSLGDLKIIGTDLFACEDEEEEPERGSEGDAENMEEDELEKTQVMDSVPRTPALLHNAVEAPAAESTPNQTVMGPHVEIITERIMLTCQMGETASVAAQFVNNGSTSIIYEWRVRPKGKGEPSTDSESCFWGGVAGTLLPGQQLSVPFLFTPSKPGVFLQTIELLTTPSLLEEGRPVVLVKGVCERPDDNSVVRRDLEQNIYDATKHDSVKELLQRVVEQVREPEPDEHFHRYLFYTRNRSRALYYYKDNCRAFCKLAADVIACHKRALRNTRWDFSVSTLKEWIEKIPLRNSHNIPDLMKQWEALVSEASVRPPPDSTRYDLMSDILTKVVKQIPRISNSHRVKLGIFEPLPHVARAMEEERLRLAEEERLKTDPKARAAAKKKAAKANKTPKKLTPEEEEKQKEEETARVEQKLKEDELDAERAKQEEEYRGLLSKDLAALLSAGISQFDGLTVPVDNLPSANTQEENAVNDQKMVSQAVFIDRATVLKSRPICDVAIWGNGVLTPDLGNKLEDPNEKKKKKPKPKKGDPVPPKKLPSPLDGKDVVLVAAGPSHAIIYTTDSFFFTLPTGGDTSGGGKGKKGNGKTSARGKKPPEGASDEKKEDEVVLPVVLPQLQGYEATHIACGSNVTVFSTHESGLYLYRHDSKQLIPHLTDKRIVSSCVTPDGLNFFAVTDEGQLWSMGDNNKTGFLGHPDKNKREQFEMIKALEGSRVVSVVCGSQHVLCLTTDGKLYGWGEAYGNGIGDKKPRGTPELIFALSPAGLAGEAPPPSKESEGKGKKGDKGKAKEQPDPAVEAAAAEDEEGKPDDKDREKVVQIACGAMTAFARTSAGRLFSWGKGQDLALGHGDNKDREVPEEVAALKDHNVKSLASGEAHTVAVSAAEAGGEVLWTWGKGSGGALGHGDTESQAAPKILEGVDGFSRVLCGLEAGGPVTIGRLSKRDP